MRPEQIIAPLQTDLEAFAAGWGNVSLAADPFNVYEILTTGPYGAQIVLHWDGDAPAGSMRQSPFVENTIEVYVGRNRGLSLEPNDTLAHPDPADGDDPLMRIVADVRERIRAYDFDAPAENTRVAARVTYGGCQSVSMPSGLPLAAYRLRFSLTTSLPTIDSDLRD